MNEMKLLITIPPNADETFDFQNAIVNHLEKGLNLEAQGDDKWDSKAGVRMEVVK